MLVKKAEKLRNFELAVQELNNFMKRPWWKIVSGRADDSYLRGVIKSLCSHCATLVRNCLKESPYALHVDGELISTLMGIFEINNADLVVISPVNKVINSREELEPLGRLLNTYLAQRSGNTAAQDDRPLDLCCQGSALYSLQSSMNHSCAPNAVLFKTEKDLDGHVVVRALRSIHEHEEIRISYIDESLPLEERQRALEEYEIFCRCPRCEDDAALRSSCYGIDAHSGRESASEFFNCQAMVIKSWINRVGFLAIQRKEVSSAVGAHHWQLSEQLARFG
ncbi:uncharacterized protein LOC135120369 [Zophobas morio]|uniref:uncharacterized protein LOC135120369 n=1 Tax=Zophobas morio TaxID=2755281 RepID=UPI0030832DCC